MTDEQITITEGQDARLTVGAAPIRIGVRPATYYIAECPHGDTQLYEVEGVDEAVVKGNLVDEHHAQLGCSCPVS